MDNQTVLGALKSRFGDAILESKEFRGELTVVVPKEKIVDVCTFLKNDPALTYDFLSDLCGIDMFTPTNRFGVIYNVLSLKNRHRFRIRTFTDETDPEVPSVTGVWGLALCSKATRILEGCTCRRILSISRSGKTFHSWGFRVPSRFQRNKPAYGNEIRRRNNPF
jgi:hypothetical protein